VGLALSLKLFAVADGALAKREVLGDDGDAEGMSRTDLVLLP
jgi:hypothetical protein